MGILNPQYHLKSLDSIEVPDGEAINSPLALPFDQQFSSLHNPTNKTKIISGGAA